MSKRFTALSEKAALDANDVMAVDNPSGGTKKFKVQKILDQISAVATAADEAIDQVDDEVTELKEALNESVTELKSDIRQMETNFVACESGTYADSAGNKVSNVARIRNISPISTRDLKTITIPNGYDAWIMRYDKRMSFIGGFGAWLNGIIAISSVVTEKTEFINFGIRKTATPSADITSDITTVENGIILTYKKGYEIIAFWNVAKGGIYTDGRSIRLKQYGFGVKVNGVNYYVASPDQTTEHAFTITTDMSQDPYYLLMDISKLLNPNGRNNPSEVLSIVSGYNYNNSYGTEKIAVAEYYKGYWDFIEPFTYFRDGSAKNALPISDIFSTNQLIAHKGGNATEENTIANFEQAITNGYKILECDVMFTSDGVGVLSHEDSFTISGTTYIIANTTYAELIAVKPNLATLKEFLLLCKQKNVIAELDFTKTYTDSEQNYIINLIVATGMTGRVFVTCYEGTARSILRKNNDIIVCISGISTVEKIPTIQDIIDNARLCICSTDYTSVTESLVTALHYAGALSKPWTVDSLVNVQSLFNIGCDFIITDNILPSQL